MKKLKQRARKEQNNTITALYERKKQFFSKSAKHSPTGNTPVNWDMEPQYSEEHEIDDNLPSPVHPYKIPVISIDVTSPKGIHLP